MPGRGACLRRHAGVLRCINRACFVRQLPREALPDWVVPRPIMLSGTHVVFEEKSHFHGAMVATSTRCRESRGFEENVPVNSPGRGGRKTEGFQSLSDGQKMLDEKLGTSTAAIV